MAGILLLTGAFIFRSQLARVARYFQDWLKQDERAEQERQKQAAEREKARQEINQVMVDPNEYEQNQHS